MKKFGHGITVAAVIGGVLLAAPAAHSVSAPSSITISACTTGSPDTITVSVSSVAWTSPTDTLNLVNNCASFSIMLYTVSGSTETNVGGASLNGGTGTTSALGSDVTAIRIRRSGPPTNPVLATLTASSPSSGGGGGSSSSTVDGSAPAPVVQQFGKPILGTCDAAAPSTLNWANVSSGGWGESWSQWMNGGTGGFVCTRSLVYSTAAARWIIG